MGITCALEKCIAHKGERLEHGWIADAVLYHSLRSSHEFDLKEYHNFRSSTANGERHQLIFNLSEDLRIEKMDLHGLPPV